MSQYVQKGMVMGGGTGNVIGPGASTLNAIAKYADTTGLLLADSGVIIDASNNMTLPGTLSVSAPVTPAGTGAVSANLSVLSNGTTQFGIGVYANTAGGSIGLGGTAAGRFRGFRAATSLTSPSAISGTATIIQIEAFGYDGSAYAQGATIQMRGNGTWNGSAHPSDMVFLVVPDASTTATTILTLNKDLSAQFAGVANASAAGLRTKVSTANVTNPPTEAEIISAFGTAASVGSGFVGIIDDNGGHANEYLVWSDGSKYFYATGTLAV